MTFTGFNLCRNLDPSNSCATKPIFWKHLRNFWKFFLGPSLKDRKSQFCHNAAKKCCSSGNYLMYVHLDICSLRHMFTWTYVHLDIMFPWIYVHLDICLVGHMFTCTYVYLYIWVDFPSRDKNLQEIAKLQCCHRCHFLSCINNFVKIFVC